MGGLKGGENNDDKKRHNRFIWAAWNLERTWLQSCNRGRGHSRCSGSIGETRETTSRITTQSGWHVGWGMKVSLSSVLEGRRAFMLTEQLVHGSQLWPHIGITWDLLESQCPGGTQTNNFWILGERVKPLGCQCRGKVENQAEAWRNEFTFLHGEAAVNSPRRLEYGVHAAEAQETRSRKACWVTSSGPQKNTP